MRASGTALALIVAYHGQETMKTPPQPEAHGAPLVPQAELIVALSFATDLGTGQPLERAVQTCLLSLRLAERIALDEDERATVYYLALLHYLGCTADSQTTAELFGDEIGMVRAAAVLDLSSPADRLRFAMQHVGAHQPLLKRARTLARTLVAGTEEQRASSRARCEVAVNIARRLELSAAVREGLWQVFEHWDGSGTPFGLRGDAIALPARVVRCARDALTLLHSFGADTAHALLRQRVGTLYDPALVKPCLLLAPELLDELQRAESWELDTEDGAAASAEHTSRQRR
jgi:hypothetical protein